MERVVRTTFGIEVDCPEHWEDRAETEDTHLLWEPYTGSLRLTLRQMGAGFDGAAFLAGEARRKASLQPQWRQIGGRSFLCTVEDRPKEEGQTRLHLYLAAEGTSLLVGSWAFDLALLDDELSEMEVEAETETAEAVLASIRGASGTL